VLRNLLGETFEINQFVDTFSSLQGDPPIRDICLQGNNFGNSEFLTKTKQYDIQKKFKKNKPILWRLGSKSRFSNPESFTLAFMLMYGL